MTCGIYQIINMQDGRRYVGQSINIERRWISHRAQYGGKTPIKKAILEFGVGNFDFTILKECLPGELDYFEQMYLDEIRYGYDYNVWMFAEGSKRGLKTPEETKRKQSLGNIGKHKPSQETLEKLHNSHLGYITSEQTKEKIRSIMTGRLFSDNHRARISSAKMGHEVSLETREKLRVAKMNRKDSDATRQKKKLAHLGKKRPAEVRLKISATKQAQKVKNESRS